MEAAKQTAKDVHSTLISGLCPGAVTTALYRDDQDAQNLDPVLRNDGNIELTTMSEFKADTAVGTKKKVHCFVQVRVSGKPRTLSLVVEVRGPVHVNYHDCMILLKDSRRAAESAATSLKQRLALL